MQRGEPDRRWDGLQNLTWPSRNEAPLIHEGRQQPMSFQAENKNQPGRQAWNRTKYIYDGDNRRASKTVGTTTTYFSYDPAGRLIQEMNPSTGEGKDYIYLDDSPLARVDWTFTEASVGNVLKAYKSGSNVHLDWSAYAPTGDSYVVRRKQVVDTNDKTFDGALALTTLDYPTETYDDPVVGNGNRYDYEVFKQTTADALFFYHTDHLGTPILMTDGSSAPVWRAEHLPFGGLFSNAVSTVQNNLRFPGQYFDWETGLHQNWFRDYAPKTGRYRETDPIGLWAGTNPYSYVDSAPTTGIDPYGLWNIWNPGLWGQANAVSWSWTDSLIPWHESSGYTREAFAHYSLRGLEAFADGVIPFGDPFESYGAYDRCDKGLEWSKSIGAWTRDAELTAAYGFAGVPQQLTHFTTAAGAAGIAETGAIEGGYGLFNPFFKGVYMARIGRPLNPFVPPFSLIPVEVSTPAWTARIIPYLVYLKAGARIPL